MRPSVRVLSRVGQKQIAGLYLAAVNGESAKAHAERVDRPDIESARLSA
jgi:hypothetical protein